MCVRLGVFSICLVFVINFQRTYSDEDVTTAAGARVKRYAFQVTRECKEFKKAFICVNKCLSLGFQVAHSDKKCKCNCFYKKDKKKYIPPVDLPLTEPTTINPYKMPAALQEKLKDLTTLPEGYIATHAGDSQYSPGDYADQTPGEFIDGAGHEGSNSTNATGNIQQNANETNSEFKPGNDTSEISSNPDDSQQNLTSGDSGTDGSNNNNEVGGDSALPTISDNSVDGNSGDGTADKPSDGENINDDTKTGEATESSNAETPKKEENNQDGGAATTKAPKAADDNSENQNVDSGTAGTPPKGDGDVTTAAA